MWGHQVCRHPNIRPAMNLILPDKATGWVEKCICGADVIHPNLQPVTFYRADMHPAPVGFTGETITYRNLWLTPFPGRDPPAGYEYCTHPIHQCPGKPPGATPTLF